MELKKYVLAVSAVALTSWSFAGNAAQTQVILEQFTANPQQVVSHVQHPSDDSMSLEEFIVGFFNSLEEMGVTASTQQEKDTDAAMKAGLVNFAKHLEAQSLDDNEQAIQHSLDNDLVVLVQEAGELQEKIANLEIPVETLQERYLSLIARLENVLKDTANRVIKNQTEVAPEKVDQERAAGMLQLFYMTIVYLQVFDEMEAQ